MLINIIKIALRNLVRNKGYSVINIAGLTFGLLVSLVITFYVIDDYTYDTFHEDAEDIYRLISIENVRDASSIKYAITAGPLMVALNEGIPEIIASTRVFGFGGVPLNRAVGDQAPDPENAVTARGIITDSRFFDIFSFHILSGAGPEALDAPGNVFITQEIADALFGDEDPLGQPIIVPNMNDAHVAGIIEAPPENSHLKFDAIAPLRPDQNPVWWDSWENLMLTGYVKLQPDSDPNRVNEKITVLGRQNGFADVYLPRLQPMLDMHLGSADIRYDQINQGRADRTSVFALTIIGLLVLLIAAINFINLSTAHASQRAREVGLRKVVGSGRGRLITQFLGESVIITIFAMFITLLLLEVFRTPIVDFLGKELNISISRNPLLLYLLLVSLGVGVLSGIYPALVLSGFQPNAVLKGKFKTSKTGITLRRILVVFQFTATIALISGVIIVYHQIDYLQNLHMGYNRDNVVTQFIPMQNNGDLMKQKLKQMPAVISAGRASNAPGPGLLRIEVIPEGSDREHSRMFQRLMVDEDFTETLEMSMITGRGFSRDFMSDTLNSIIINETAYRMSGWTDPIGKRMEVVEVDGNPVEKRVIGVFRDMHFTPARLTMEPMFLQLDPNQSGILFMRLGAGNTPETMAAIEAEFQQLFPEVPFAPRFLDEMFSLQFNTDRGFAANMGVFSLIAIFIACLGLLGLVSYTVRQRRQEIAVRKVLGCSVPRIVSILAVDFLRWVLLANLAAWPLSYLAMRSWLDGFVYRAPFSLTPFIISGVIVLIIAALTLGYQALRAALANPIDSLRYE